MINLIPNQEKKEMIKSFRYRLAVLFLMTVSFSVFIVFISILPSYFLSSVKSNIANNRLEIQKSEPVSLPDRQTITAIGDLDKKLDLIEIARSNKFIFSQKVINSIILKKTPDIKITSIAYQNDQFSGKKVSIGGTAPSREVLLAFRQALENDTAFENVNLPISNFVRGSNIPFYLSLILRPNQDSAGQTSS